MSDKIVARRRERKKGYPKREASRPGIEEGRSSRSPLWAPRRGSVHARLRPWSLPLAALLVPGSPGSRPGSPTTSTATPSWSPPGARLTGSHLWSPRAWPVGCDSIAGFSRSEPRASAQVANVAAGAGRPRPGGSGYRPGRSPPSTHQASGSAKSPRLALRRETEALEGGDLPVPLDS